ncbi:Ig-like domain-containing protein [Wenzhouxiangella marina]|uniref:Uncharacterized protein n=1 Tax=Wenzhouxiangella marina TaxID=1579979 RepID=A0A0K0Y003_9GAMM|nr:Ig-like domain-containing protein [Wenzhouxiangella marina]AKS43273.1 hypothetical protein WM2015_2916 [Wenzhouxiangella marina]MBB6087040.1 DNA-binding beta-propeller fold protein YncE [Wenzhouxiangella marina]
MPRPFHLLSSALCLCFLISLNASAQVPPVNPGFPDELSCQPGELLYRQVGLGRVANIIYHNGVLLSNNVGGGARRWWRFTDPDDPTTLSIYATDEDVPTDHGTHAATKIGDYACGAWGCRVRSDGPGQLASQLMPPSAPGEISGGFTPQNQPEPAGGGLHRLYYPWALPFNWIQYGANPGQGRLWRGDELLAEWEPLADHGVAGNAILIGNYLFMVSDASMLGVVSYDISPVFETPPGPPRFLDKLSGAFGAYIGAVWKNYLVLAGGEPRNLLYVVDYSDPTALSLVTTLDLTGNPDLDAGTNVPYVQTQDEYVFTRRHKINMETLTPELELDEVGNNRPPGSVAGPLDVSQYKLPIGNLLVTGSYSFGGRDGVGVWCHQASPDNRAPYVDYHIPRPGQTGYPLGAPISLIIPETLESFTIINGETVIVRPVGGQALDAWASFSHDGILTITPYEYFEPDTTYEVIVTAGGIKDAAGNGIEGYSFTFSTGEALGGGNGAPEISQFEMSASPVDPGQSVTLSVSASDPESDPLEYRFSPGDGSPSTAWTSSAQYTHSFTETGHFEVKVQVRDQKPDGTTSVVTETRTLTVASLPAGPLPVSSSSIQVDETRRLVWSVNRDNDTVARIDADTGALLSEIDLPTLLGEDQRLEPVSLAVVPSSGQVWIALSKGDGLAVLDASGALVDAIDTGYGSAPQAVLVSPDQAQVFVSTRARANGDRGAGQVLRFATSTGVQTGQLDLGPEAGAMALSGDGSRLFIARFISAEHHGEIWEVDAQAMSLTRTIRLRRDRGRAGLDGGGSQGPGVPNYLASLVIDPHGDWLWYTAIKADTNRGLFFDQGTGLNLPLAHDTTVRPMLGRIDLNAPVPVEPGVDSFGNERLDGDNADSPSAIVFSPRGDYVFTSFQGNDTVAIFDDLAIRAGSGRTSLARLEVGSAPRGIAFDATGNTVWVENFLGRSVSRIDVDAFLATGERAFPSSELASSGIETLAPDVLAGKRLFYFAGNDPEGSNPMSFEGYISCASCHIDGGHDGRTWDFSQRGEGFRNTQDLRGRAGLGHGNLHWTENFDEPQDFILDIMGEFDGTGFLPEGESPHPSLGAPNAGRSTELDQLAAYMNSLDRGHLPRSPWRQSNGQISAAALAGADHFASLGCAGCHDPLSDYTDASVGAGILHDVGTLRTSSGMRLGGTLAGMGTPTLLGLWNTAPYFHDGSAAALDEVFTVAGGEIFQAEDAALAGGAMVPNWIEINWDSTAHGALVEFGSNGASATFNGVDGGSGGLGAIELRMLPNTGGVFRLTVNGSHVQDLSFDQQQVAFDWRRLRFENVPLNAGTGNTVVVSRLSTSSWQSPALDHITVSTVNDLAQAQAHRSAASLSPTELAELRAYLLELDGRDPNGLIIDPDRIFRDRFQ